MIRRIAAFAALLALFSVPLIARSAEPELRSILDRCMGCNLSGKDLHGIDLHGITMIGTNLQRVNFDGAHLSDIRFTGVDLDDANLNNADLRNAHFVGTSLRGTTFLKANLDGATFTGVSLQRSNIIDGDHRGMIRTCTGCNLEGVDLSSADLRSIRFVGANFRDAKFVKSDLRDANLVGANLRSANLDSVQLSGANLVGANMRGASVHGAAFDTVRLCSRNPSYYGDDSDRRDTACADLRDVDLHGIDLSHALWCDEVRNNATCRAVTRAELVDLAHADLSGAIAPAT
jgi:uncharacterized protein YjbI with pentapeptide repeats